MTSFANLPDEGENISQSYPRKIIAEIKPGDELIQIVAFARKVNPSYEFVADDTTGHISIRGIPDEYHPIQEGRLYKILGALSIDGAGATYLEAKVVGDVTGLNLELYQQSLELLKKIP